MIPNNERAISLAILQALGWESDEHVVHHAYHNGLNEQRPGFIRLINGYMTSGVADDGEETNLVWQTWLGATCLWDALWLKERLYDLYVLRAKYGDRTWLDREDDYRGLLSLYRAEATNRIHSYVLTNDPDAAIQFFFSRHPIEVYRKYLNQMMEGWSWSSAAETDLPGMVWQAYARLAAIIEAVYLREDIPGNRVTFASPADGTLPVYGGMIPVK